MNLNEVFGSCILKLGSYNKYRGVVLNLDFNVTLERKYNFPYISISGELDLNTCAKFNDVLKKSVDDSDKIIILNLENTQYMDSTALGVVARVAKTLAEKGGALKVICQKSHILKLFSISGLLKKNITVYESVELATADVTSGV